MPSSTKRHATVKSKNVAVSGSGALLINDHIEPEFVDFISFRYQGKDIVFYDANLKGLYPWKVCEDQVHKTNKEGTFVSVQPQTPSSKEVADALIGSGIFVSVQPKTPSSKEVADALIGSGYAGADTKRIFGPNDLEIFMNKESMTAFNCPLPPSISSRSGNDSPS